MLPRPAADCCSVVERSPSLHWNRPEPGPLLLAQLACQAPAIVLEPLGIASMCFAAQH